MSSQEHSLVEDISLHEVFKNLNVTCIQSHTFSMTYLNFFCCPCYYDNVLVIHVSGIYMWLIIQESLQHYVVLLALTMAPVYLRERVSARMAGKETTVHKVWNH